MLFALSFTSFAAWATGRIVPISLLASIIVTRIVRSVMASVRSDRSTMPYRSTGRYVIS